MVAYYNQSVFPGLPRELVKGRDLKTTSAGCFQDPEYRWGDFGTTDGGVLQPIRHPVYGLLVYCNTDLVI